MGNTFGKIFRVTTFGESHGAALGCVVDGCPPRLALKESDIQFELDRRRPGQSAVATARKEKDEVKILSGVFEGKTLGTPIAMIVENKDARFEDYKKFKNIFRKGHADRAYFLKYDIRDWRGGGRASGRETVARVMAGAIAKKILKMKKFVKKPVLIYGYALQIGPIRGEKIDLNFIEKNPVRAGDKSAAKKMENYILKLKKEEDSCGGIVEILVKNMPAGLGEPVFDKLNADLAKALFSIPAVKALEFDSGFIAAVLKGSEHNKMQSGISGGIATGADLIMRIVVKPPSSITVKGRHDPCIVPRFIPVAESMVALTLVDHLLRYRTIK